MADTNRHGLGRDIPADVRREIRRRSRFGCVVCRRGFYQYEHLDPPFEDATEHDPERICCLCGSCHDSVTRGQFSKEFVGGAYKRIQQESPEMVAPPVGPLDFHDGSAELAVGGLLYTPAVRTVLRYHGTDVVRLIPGAARDEPGRISAIFTGDIGEVVLRLEENEWIGSLDVWDTEVVGRRLTVRRTSGDIVLQLRLDAPGRIIVERLDMRVHDAHVLATEATYAAGRYLTDGSVHRVHAHAHIRKSSPHGAAIEFTDPQELEARDRHFQNTSQELATANRDVVMSAHAGILVKPLGVATASLCRAFDLAELAIGNRPLADMRRVILRYPREIGGFISTGQVRS